jgi:orotidine-5'-phosphate decarboxylase
MKNSEFIYEQIQRKKSLLCVGLDPELHKIPSIYLQVEFPLLEYCRDIIECTEKYAIAYKINIAFFEALGPVGWTQLEKIVKYIPSECLLIADAKRGDIGHTSRLYAEYYFTKLNADAVTLSPYMGKDSLEPFLEYKNKYSVILALTSNPGSSDFELQVLKKNDVYLYESVISTFLNSAYNSNIMFVCGATHPAEFSRIRKLCPDHFLLVPGVGTQGGDLKNIILSGKNRVGGLLINVSRKITYPDSTHDCKNAVKNAAKSYQEEIFKYL